MASNIVQIYTTRSFWISLNWQTYHMIAFGSMAFVYHPAFLWTLIISSTALLLLRCSSHSLHPLSSVALPCQCWCSSYCNSCLHSLSICFFNASFISATHLCKLPVCVTWQISPTIWITELDFAAWFMNWQITKEAFVQGLQFICMFTETLVLWAIKLITVIGIFTR